ncbi:TPA: pilus assembly protein [Escherichia coli]|nr:pilus assembly protein [Escherichia coli]HBB9579099.1 pilus assembly protein [Escherichia coli]HCI2584175.1 pilus assembly protein [Escherichia coli]HCI3050077.1 pilus assembly protein [Escherichia coli]HCI3357593.1 pilus assembly protein [Escherichia coli]
MRLIFNHPKINNKKDEKGLSLIESAMVLALAATVTAGVMFYYQSASDSNKTQSAISEVMSATSAINGLYIGQSSYDGLTASVLKNSSAIPENYKSGEKIMNPFGGELKVGAATAGKGFGYYIALENLPKSACISLATLNLGTSAAGYGVVTNATDSLKDTALASTPGVQTTPISPSNAATLCSSNGSTNKVVVYFMK